MYFPSRFGNFGIVRGSLCLSVNVVGNVNESPVLIVQSAQLGRGRSTNTMQPLDPW